jgi:hypothetical protein
MRSWLDYPLLSYLPPVDVGRWKDSDAVILDGFRDATVHCAINLHRH